MAVLGVVGALSVSHAGPRETWRVRVPVLMYHHVQELSGEPGAAWVRYTVSPGAFAGQLDWLKANGFETVTAERLVRALEPGDEDAAEALPPKPVVLTFDDGWACCHDTVFPALKQRGMTGTFFVYPSGVGSPGYVSWAQLREMRDGGMDVQAHSMTHPHLPTLSEADAWKEIESCREVMGEKMGETPSVFAYPFGEYSEAVLRAVERAGYTGAFSTDVGTEHSAGEVFRLKRVIVTYPDDVSVFARVVGGGG